MRRKLAPIHSKIKTIKAAQVVTDPATKPLRVAVYCRISSLNPDSSDSIEHQVKYFTQLINTTPNWVIAGVYVDNGRSGLQKHNRPALQRMLKHCKEGRIDKVLTKSASRISRSARDFLEIVNSLKDMGIGIEFDRENFDTLSTDSDFLLTTFAAIAQEESRSQSENRSWAIQRKFASGIPLLRRMLGYEVINRGTYWEVKVIEDEARIVREIFDMALAGQSLSGIARHLIAQGYKTILGSSDWGCASIKCILQNVTYTGSPINNKYYKRHYQDRYCRINKGEHPSYQFENYIEAIITRDQYDKAQQYLQQFTSKPANTWVRYPLSGRLICGECGIPLNRRSKNDKQYSWFCPRQLKSPILCQLHPFRESDIESAMKEAFKTRYPLDKPLIFKKLKSDLKRIIEFSAFENDRLSLQNEVNDALKLEHASEGDVQNRAREERIRLETEFKKQEKYWDQMENDYEYRNRSLIWLNQISRGDQLSKKLEAGLTIEIMRAWILSVKVFLSGGYSFVWFDNQITNIRKTREIQHKKKKTPELIQKQIPKEISVTPTTQPKSAGRKARQQIAPIRFPPISGLPRSLKESGKLRVASYCRVSSADHSQQSSFELQIAHYTKYIQSNPEWQFAGVYADEASGTNLKNRPNFVRMIEDAKNGEIDLIICKSISRFSRSVVDFLTYIRMLKDLNPPVNVYLEKENLYTLAAQSEVVITLLSALAQEESFANSENAKWGIEKRQMLGIVPSNRICYGYSINEKKQWIIDEQKAEIVRRIYREYLAGKSSLTIAKDLTQDQILRPDGSNRWTYLSVLQILHNDTYIGNVTMNKSYSKDHLTHKRVVNRGERPQYLIENHHPSIIDKHDFERVQMILKERTKIRNSGRLKTVSTDKKKRYYRLFTCSRCQSVMVISQVPPGREILECCTNRNRGGKDKCHLPCISVDNMEYAFSTLLMEMKYDRDQIQAEARIAIENAKPTEIQIKRKEELIVLIEGKISELCQESINIQDSDSYDIQTERIAKLTTEIEQLQNELRQIEKQQASNTKMEDDLSWLMKTLDNLEEFVPNQKLVAFRVDIFDRLINSGEVLEDYKIRMKLSIGIERTIQCMNGRIWKGMKQKIANREKSINS